MLRQKLAYDCRSPKRFHVRRTALVAQLCRANRWFFITDFQINILCSRPSRAVNDILKNCGDFLESMAILNFSVCKGHA